MQGTHGEGKCRLHHPEEVKCATITLKRKVIDENFKTKLGFCEKKYV